MARRPKRPKTPRDKGGGRKTNSISTDPVTGLAIDVDGTTILSDKVYLQTYEDALKSGAFGLKDIYPIEYEVELSPSLIAFTVRQSPSDPGTYRGVFKGDFKTKGNKVVSARIDEFAQRGRFSDGEGGFYENGSIYSVGKELKNPFSAKQWMTALSNSMTERGWFSDENSQGGLGKQAVTGFGGGQVLQDGWWQDPFTPNLI
jgi:hypothetical protein